MLFLTLICCVIISTVPIAKINNILYRKDCPHSKDKKFSKVRFVALVKLVQYFVFVFFVVFVLFCFVVFACLFVCLLTQRAK